MNTICKGILTWLCLFTCCFEAGAQNDTVGNHTIQLGTIMPHQISVTYDKTTHLIFPAAIRYIDLGSDHLIAEKAESAENVLRIKAATRDFEEETNFSVITEDGHFYTFNVYYSVYPDGLAYDLDKMNQTAGRRESDKVLFTDLGSNAPSLTYLIMETLHKQQRRLVKHIASSSYGIQFRLKAIYIHNGKYYFQTEVRNKSNVPFTIDFIKFKIVDRKTAKRTVSQELALEPLRAYGPANTIAANAKEQNIYLLDQFTLTGDQLLLIELFEKNGGRHQQLQVENADLINSRPITDLHLKID